MAIQLNKMASDDGITRIALVGRLDVLGAAEVDLPFHAATAAAGQPTIVDCTGLEFVGSLGMGIFFACARALKGRGATMVLMSPPAEVAEALRTAGVDQATPIAVDEAAAMSALQM